MARLASRAKRAGADITNVKAIMSARFDSIVESRRASGNWRIGEDGNLVVKKVTADELQITDSKTSEPYCVRLAYGEWEKIKGVCDPDTATSTPTS